MSDPFDTDETRVVDTTGWIPMQLQRAGFLQDRCKQLEPFLKDGELAKLQAIYELWSYADMSLDQLLFMRELELRARGD